MDLVGNYFLRTRVSELGELREAVKQLDTLGVPDDFEVDVAWDDGHIILTVAPSDEHDIVGEIIECADHHPSEGRQTDVLLSMHKCTRAETTETEDGLSRGYL
jgi:hypothetical protein